MSQSCFAYDYQVCHGFVQFDLVKSQGLYLSCLRSRMGNDFLKAQSCYQVNTVNACHTNKVPHKSGGGQPADNTIENVELLPCFCLGLWP